MSIADRITSMSNNLSSAYDGIEYLGVDTTGVDKNLQNLSSMLNVVYEGLPKVSDEGVSPSIVGSRVGRLKSTLKASDTTQFSTTGKNKYHTSNYEIWNISSGIPYTKLSPDVANVTINSIDNNNVNFTVNTNAYRILLSQTYILEANTSYIISFKRTDTANNPRFYVYNVDNSDVYTINLNLNNQTGDLSATFTTNEYGKVAFAFGTGNTDSGKTIDIANIMVRPASITDDTYEPYTNGASPNPDYPQDIHVVKGNNTVEVCGKNLFNANADYTTRNGITSVSVNGNNIQIISTNANTNAGCVWNIPVTVGENLVISYSNMEEQTSSSNNYVSYYFSDIPMTRDNWNYGTTVNKTYKAVAVTSTAKYLCIMLRTGNGNSHTVSDLMVERGSTSTTYEPYNGTAYPINLPVQNLFDKNVEKKTAFPNGNAGQIVSYTSSTKTYSYVNSAYLKAGETYTLSWEMDGTPSAATARDGKIVDGNNVVLENIVTWDNNTTHKTFTPNYSGYLILATDINSTNIQIEPGNKANRYTPYGVAPIELCKIGDYQDYFYKENGNWYKYGEAGKVVLNGTEDWNYASGVFYITSIKNYKSSNNIPLCNYYKGYQNVASASSVPDNSVCFRNTITVLRLYIKNSSITTESDFEAWLSTHNTIVYYQLATPVITQIIDTTLISQLEALYKSQSKNGQTNVLQTNADNPFVIYASALKGV